MSHHPESSPKCHFQDGYEPPFRKTRRRVLTRRGVIWLGQTCNLRCQFCYFLDRIKAKDHPEHPFMSLDKAKHICAVLVDCYSNNAVDIQGGEPLIYPEIYQLLEYCRKIGLLPTLITNAIVLTSEDRCKQLLDSGIRDLLISVHGLGTTYDTIVGVPGAHLKQMKALDNLQKWGIPFRFNSVVSKSALPELGKIAELAAETGSRAVNFIAFNPFEDQEKSGKRSTDNVAAYEAIAPVLNDALDILEKNNVEGNVRYLPICLVEKRHWKSMYNFQQLPYDLHEWDYASWSWTGLQPQRMRAGDTQPPVSLEESTFVPLKYQGLSGRVADMVKELVQRYPSLHPTAASIHKKISMAVKKKVQYRDIDHLYRENGKLRASVHCLYSYAEACTGCSAKGICDGLHGDYAEFFGTDGVRPIAAMPFIDDPRFFINEQEKVVECEDYGWAL